MTNLTVANTILEQLGGRRFIAMTGSKNFVGSQDKLTFSLAPNKSKGNKMRITLTPADDYTVEVFKIRGTEVKPLASVHGVYADSLRSVFESLTGMYICL
jgi:hypothetical protein